MNRNNTLSHSLEIAMHLLAWLFLFASPLLFMSYGHGIDWEKYLLGSLFPCILCVIFYTNYLGLTPKLFLRGKKQQFFLYETLLILFLFILLSYGFQALMPANPHHHERMANLPPRWLFMLRDGCMLIFFAAMGVVTRLSMEWRKSEAARKEAELGRTAAELKNLRNQINPHFLLNTLNNIYALTAFNTEKAQAAIQELSSMLRYLLYENQQTYVALQKEVDFLHTYIELMRIRMASNVQIIVDMNIEGATHIPVAPLIFISLVENAFKHGISPQKPSFISIKMSVNARKDVSCQIENSNYPKTPKDKSGSGIGLAQVQQRLELLYPGRYIWMKGVNEVTNTYISSLTIQTSKEHDSDLCDS